MIGSETERREPEKIPSDIFCQDVSKSFLELYSSDDLSHAADFLNVRHRLITNLFVYILMIAIMFFSCEAILAFASVLSAIFIYKLYQIKYGGDCSKDEKDIFWSTIVLMATALIVGAYAVFAMLLKGNDWGWLFVVVALIEAYCSFLVYFKAYRMMSLMEPIRSVQSIVILEGVSKFLAQYDFKTDSRVVKFHYHHGLNDEKMVGLLMYRYAIFYGTLGTIEIVKKTDFHLNKSKKFPFEARYSAVLLNGNRKCRISLRPQSMLRLALWKARA